MLHTFSVCTLSTIKPNVFFFLSKSHESHCISIQQSIHPCNIERHKICQIVMFTCFSCHLFLFLRAICRSVSKSMASLAVELFLAPISCCSSKLLVVESEKWIKTLSSYFGQFLVCRGYMYYHLGPNCYSIISD